MTTLQDIMGLITKRKIKTPSDNDYIISAAYSDTQERLKPQPKMEASLLSLGGIKKYVLASIAPPNYKVFTALLTQTGGDSTGSINFNNPFPLVIGTSYIIIGNLLLNQGGTDFTNVGAPNNNIGTSFIATGTTPIWGTEDGQLIFNEGAPVAKVLENTIGNVWFSYIAVGNYCINSNGLFTVGKSWTPTIQIFNDSAGLRDGEICEIRLGDSNGYYITTFDQTGEGVDTKLDNTPIEIRVYN